MDFNFNVSLTDGYKSNSQKVRIMSETWLAQNIFCPNCGNPHLNKMENNKPVSDFCCSSCGELFELKAKKNRISGKINDGAYSTMIERITSTSNPDLFIMQYENMQVSNLMVIPKFFFTPDIIEKRKPLSENVRRAGWVGCNILIDDIPKQGKINIIEHQHLCDKDDILNAYKYISKMKTSNIESRGWLLDVLNCINEINKTDFELSEVYRFTEVLQNKHINNNHIEAKIRQQLQILRDKGYIEFLERGHYRKINL